MPHLTVIKVRGYHCDFYGHVNNARYLELMEEARWQYLEAGMGLEYWSDRGLGFVVAGIEIKYKYLSLSFSGHAFHHLASIHLHIATGFFDKTVDL